MVLDRGISKLREYDNFVGIMAVLSTYNFDSFDNGIVDFAEKYNLEGGIYLALETHGKLLEKKASNEIIKKILSVWKYGRKKGIAVSGYWSLPYSRMLTKNAEFPYYITCLGYGLSIDSSGEVYPCRHMMNKIGCINKLNMLLKSREYYAQAMRIYNPACKGCEIEGLCIGSCLADLENKFNDIYAIDKDVCTIYKAITKELIKHEGSRELSAKAKKIISELQRSKLPKKLSKLLTTWEIYCIKNVAKDQKYMEKIIEMRTNAKKAD